MFNFFKKQNKNSQLFDWELDLLSSIFEKIGDPYLKYQKQIQEGLLIGIRLYDKFPNYVGFKFNISLLNKYEDKLIPESELLNIKVFNVTSSNYESIKIKLGYGLILGYEIDNRQSFIPDLNRIEINEEMETIQYNDDFNAIEKLFTKDELSLINQSEIYEVILNNKKYYHLFDLQDGDFIGVDHDKIFYKISHDPFRIEVQNLDLQQIKENFQL